MKATLIYVHDPMCSWCWGFEPVKKKLFEAVAADMDIRYLVGGLAADSDQPMTEEMKSMLQQTWQRIAQAIPGTEFNHDFWTNCSPRRSTYPANRAVIAARVQGQEYGPVMTLRIQQAYYTEARNPSDASTLIELAKEIRLDVDRFTSDITSLEIQTAFTQELDTVASLGVSGFPSLVILKGDKMRHLTINYTDVDEMLQQINHG